MIIFRIFWPDVLGLEWDFSTDSPEFCADFLGFCKWKLYYIGEFVLFSTILNRTIPGMVLSETVLSGDPCTEVGRAPLIHFQKIFFQKGFH